MTDSPQSINGMPLEEIIMIDCLHRVFKPSIDFPKEGVGFCRRCAYDVKNNPKCKDYYPITLRYFEAK